MSPNTPSSITSLLGKERLKTGGGGWRLVSFMGFVLLAFLFSYFGVAFGYRNFLEAQITKQENELEELARQVPQEQQDEFLKFEFQIINLQKLLTNRRVISKFLPLIEANTHAQVYYESMDINVDDREATIRIVAPSYEVLAQQVEAYQKIPEVTRYQMTTIAPGEGGQLKTNITLYFSFEIFRI